MRPADTWVCVADAVRAHFYRCDGPGRGVEPILDYMMVAPSHHNTHEDQARFAGRLALQLDRAAAERLFAHLLLVAPAAMLGALRHVLDPHTRTLVCGEIDKDLTHVTPRELSTHLGDKLPH